jgi:hypothetical protein
MDTAFMLFLDETRAETKQKHPEATLVELLKMMSQTWKDMSDAEKQKYMDRAVTEKENYARAMAEYEKQQK